MKCTKDYLGKLKNEIIEKEKMYNELKNTSLNLREENNKDIEKIIKQYLNLENPTKEFMRVIINKILIHQDKQIDIIFNFKKLNNLLNKTA